MIESYSQTITIPQTKPAPALRMPISSQQKNDLDHLRVNTAANGALTNGALNRNFRRLHKEQRKSVEILDLTITCIEEKQRELSEKIEELESTLRQEKSTSSSLQELLNQEDANIELKRSQINELERKNEKLNASDDSLRDIVAIFDGLNRADWSSYHNPPGLYLLSFFSRNLVIDQAKQKYGKTYQKGIPIPVHLQGLTDKVEEASKIISSQNVSNNARRVAPVSATRAASVMPATNAVMDRESPNPLIMGSSSLATVAISSSPVAISSNALSRNHNKLYKELFQTVNVLDETVMASLELHSELQDRIALVESEISSEHAHCEVIKGKWEQRKAYSEELQEEITGFEQKIEGLKERKDLLNNILKAYQDLQNKKWPYYYVEPWIGLSLTSRIALIDGEKAELGKTYNNGVPVPVYLHKLTDAINTVAQSIINPVSSLTTSNTTSTSSVPGNRSLPINIPVRRN